MAAPTVLTYGIPNIDETLTLTMTNLLPGIKDNVFKKNTALKWFQSKGVKRKGGVTLSHGLLYGNNTSAKAYQRYDVLDTTPQDGLTRDQWQWAQYAVSVSIDGFTERVVNAGDQAIEDAVEVKKMQAEQALSLLLEQDIFAASPGAKSIQSLPVIILGSGSIGDVNGTTNAWWQSQIKSSGSFAAQGRSDLTNLVNAISVLNPVGLPELLLSDQNSYEFYESSLVAQERFVNTSKADVGLMTMTFKEIPWQWSPQSTSGVIYALNSDAIEFTINSGTDFIMTPFKQPTNQDARVAQILLAACMNTGMRRKLGKMTGVTA